MVTTFAMAVVLLSIVVVTGYAGQLSLGQFALAGFGALGRRPPGRRLGLAVRAGARSSASLGDGRRSAPLFAIPAVRARGLNLAIVTLGLGTTLELMVFNNRDLVGGFGGTVVGKPTLFGWDIQAIALPVPLRHRLPGLLRAGWP